MYKTTIYIKQIRFLSKLRSTLLLLMVFVGGVTWAQTTGTVQIGSGTNTSNGSTTIPVTNYVYNYSQQIVTANEIAMGGGAEGDITKIRYQVTSVGTLTVWNEWTVYVGNTTKTEFSSSTDWVDVDDLTEVFSGTITATANNWFEIEFDQPFNYTGDNLVIAVHEEAPGWTTSPTFLVYSSTPNSGIYYRSDSTNPNPDSPPTATSRTATLPQIQFEMTLADCLPPTDINVVELTDSSAEIEWTSGDGQDAWLVYVTDFGEPAPDDTTTDYETATSTTFIIDDLDPSTQYDIYIKSDCGTDGESLWIGPLTIYTTQIPAQLPFEEDFEGNIEWTLNNGTYVNQWVVGDATGNDGNSLYISNDEGDTHAYTNTSSTVAHAYRDIQIPADSESILLSFDWLAQAESCCDYIRVWVVPSDYTPVPGTQISTANSGGVQFGGNYNQQSTWTNQFFEIPSTDYAGQILRLVFEWRNDGSVGTQPPGAIDNIEVSEVTCPTPTDLNVDGVTSESADISWTSEGDLFDIEWGEIGFEQGGDDANLEEGIDSNEYTIEDLDAETNYEFYVLRDCGDDGVSAWAGPFPFFTGYCEATSSWTSDVITSFSTSGAILNIDNTTGTTISPGGYGDFTDMVVAHFETGEIDISGTSNISMGVNIWVDWNNNLQFEEDEKVYASGSTANTFSGTFSIPVGTPLGDYRMRVRGQWNNSNPQPCGNISYGETEDYTLTVIDVPDCMPPTALEAEATSMTAADLSWTSDGDLFDIEWGEAGFDQGDGTIVTDIEETAYSLTNLTPDTEYEFYVKQDCGVNGESLWAGPYLFFTGYCESTATYTSDHITAFSTSGAIMNIDNQSGSPGSPNGYANYSSMVVAHFETGEIEVSITNSASMGINIWVDWNNNLEFEESEKVYSSGATGTAFTGTFSVPAGTPLGNYRMRVRGQWGNSNLQPCGNVSWGETEDYTLMVIDPPACMPPTQVNIIQVTDDSLEVGWTAPDDQDTWQVLVLPAGSPVPDETTTGWTSTTENPFTVDGLDPATEYDAYVRADCGVDDGVSLWAGPASATTTQIAADVDFEDDFEGESGWTFTNDSQTNQWHVGTATSYQGGSSLYISNDNGNTNAYTTSSAATTTHAIRDLAFPANTNEATISFWWKARGEGTTYVYDYMRVWLMPSTFQPTSGTLITDVEGGIQLGGNFNNQEEWEQFFELLDLSAFAGQTGRLIFEWRNDTSGGTQPPAAVDNVEVKLVTCSRPIEVTVEKNQVTGDLLASWTPVAGETQWEVIVQAADEPAPDETATGIIVDQPQYLIEDVVEGEFYRIYVRAICDEDDKSLWTDGVDFSDFNPPACANIDMEFPDLTMDEQGDFIFCAADGQLTLDLVAEFDDSMFKATTSYDVEQIEFEPPFPTLGGIELALDIDDTWSPPFQLPFEFCFYGNEFSTVQVGTNGMLSFGTDFCTTGGCAPWSMSGVDAFPDPNYTLKNVIMGVYQDINPNPNSTNPFPENASMNYQVLGTYPCRALVVNFNEVPHFSCGVQLGAQTYQIVIYEITNIIEVYIYNRTSCSFNQGKGVVGLINLDGTEATIPPGRNVGTWEAQEEAWRFTPSGETSVEFGWYINGEFYSDNPIDQITVTEDTCVEARVTYPGCGGDDLVLTKEFCVKVAPDITLDKPEDIKVCLVDGEYEPIDLTDKIPEAIATLSQIENFDLADYDFTFYLSESDANANTNPIINPENHVPSNLSQTIWIRAEHKSTACYGLTNFVIYEGVGLDLNRPDNVVLCVYFDIIPETDLSRVNEQLLDKINDTQGLIVNYYHSQQDAIFGNNSIADWANFEAPYLPYEIWIKVSGSEEICESITSFTLLEGVGLPEFEQDDFEICTGYVLPILPEGYFYTTEYLAEGDHVQPGTVIEQPGLHTIYVNIISNEGCITSSSYNVNIIECTVPRGISPNGDGLNDSFDLTDYFLIDLKIYNRDGREVYSHGMGYTNEWEGQSNSGSLLPDGTYYYRIVTPVEELTGWVQLVRETK